MESHKQADYCGPASEFCLREARSTHGAGDYQPVLALEAVEVLGESLAFTNRPTPGSNCLRMLMISDHLEKSLLNLTATFSKKKSMKIRQVRDHRAHPEFCIVALKAQGGEANNSLAFCFYL